MDPASPHQVFISYSTKDTAAAEALCQALEQRDLRCWIAPRDIVGGELWRVAALEAIKTAQAVVLVLSPNSNVSDEVGAEIDRAKSHKVPVIPIAIESVEPSPMLELALAGRHRLRAFPPPFEGHLGHVVDSVLRLIRGIPLANAYLIQRGPAAHRDYTNRPGGSWRANIGVQTVEELRNTLIQDKVELLDTEEVRVRGTLYPCALLSSGWWEHRGAKTQQLKWRDSLQGWLFHGFDEWGPSWDFTWDFEHWSVNKDKPYFIAQLGMGDEANSIPVLLPAEKARSLQERFDRGWGGLEVVVSGVLGHRRHFAEHIDPRALELFGGLLDYCVWVDEGNKDHKVTRLPERTDIYSGYLWKCLAPKSFLKDAVPSLEDVYFIWEHVNFADKDALAYCLESMHNKEEYVRRRYGDLVLIQKSSALVPGTPTLAADTVYGMLMSKAGEDI